MHCLFFGPVLEKSEDFYYGVGFQQSHNYLILKWQSWVINFLLSYHWVVVVDFNHQATSASSIAPLIPIIPIAIPPVA